MCVCVYIYYHWRTSRKVFPSEGGRQVLMVVTMTGFIYIATIHIFAYLPRAISVSYTHLDVYKRQP